MTKPPEFHFALGEKLKSLRREGVLIVVVGNIVHNLKRVKIVTSFATGPGTGIGGGMMRDVLVREIPTVLRTDIYALAALIGATAIMGGHALHLRPIWQHPWARPFASEFAWGP